MPGLHLGRILMARVGADQVAEPDLVAEVEDLVDLRVQCVKRIVRAHTLQARILHRRIHLVRIMPEKAGSLHFLVSHRAKLVQCAFVILRQLLAHRVQLQAQWQSQWIRHQPRRPQRNRPHYCCRRSLLQKTTPGKFSHHPHLIFLNSIPVTFRADCHRTTRP